MQLQLDYLQLMQLDPLQQPPQLQHNKLNLQKAGLSNEEVFITLHLQGWCEKEEVVLGLESCINN